MCLYVLNSVLLISLVFLCCPVMYFYVLSSVLLISLVFSCCPGMYLYVLSSVLLISLVCLCCPIMYLYVLSSVLLISLVFFVLSCYVSLCFEFRVAYFFSFCRVVLLCIFMFWVPCCSFHNCFSCCPVMYLYVLNSVLLIFLGFFCVVLLCVFMFWVPCCSFL